jgi:hypothetical protein
MKKAVIRFLLFAVALLVSCAVSFNLSTCISTPPATDTDRIRDYNQPLQAIFDATKAVLSGFNAEIIQSDSAGGILVARRHLGGEMATAILLGKASAIFSTYRLNLFTTNAGTRIQLRIVAAYADGSHESEFAKPGYDEFWAKLEKALSGF